MAGRPTIADLARTAGVSVATVDRVLNGRARVREETQRRIYDAARQIGYHATALIGQRVQADLPVLRAGFVLQKERQAFWQAFRHEIEASAAAFTRLRIEPVIRFAASQTPRDFAELMLGMERVADVVAASAVAHVETADAVGHLQARGLPCYALLNDFAQGVRQGYVGLNNLRVGRIAAHMIATAVHRPGKIAVFVGGHRWHGHELRETGFRSYFREFAPACTVLDSFVNLETRQLTYEATLDLLARHPDLRGIYCAGGGMEGAIEALRETRAPGEVGLVVNEITPESRRALADRIVTMVIATPIQKLCTDLFHLMADTREKGFQPTPGQHFLRPDLYLPESV